MRAGGFAKLAVCIREDRPRWLEFMRAAGIKPE
jgi:hypothetical protein